VAEPHGRHGRGAPWRAGGRGKRAGAAAPAGAGHRRSRRAAHRAPAWTAALLGAAALTCGDSGPEGAASPPPSGTYRVEGATVPLDAGPTEAGRPIEGLVILVRDGERYTASFHLETVFPADEGLLRTRVVGQGQGRVEGADLVGTAETQILTGAVPDVDPRFPFLATQYGARVSSQSWARLGEGGRLEIEIETRAAEGFEYRATRTRLRGRPAPPRGVAGFPPVGAERMARSGAASPDVSAPPR